MRGRFCLRVQHKGVVYGRVSCPFLRGGCQPPMQHRHLFLTALTSDVAAVVHVCLLACFAFWADVGGADGQGDERPARVPGAEQEDVPARPPVAGLHGQGEPGCLACLPTGVGSSRHAPLMRQESTIPKSRPVLSALQLPRSMLLCDRSWYAARCDLCGPKRLMRCDTVQDISWRKKQVVARFSASVEAAADAEAFWQAHGGGAVACTGPAEGLAIVRATSKI